MISIKLKKYLTVFLDLCFPKLCHCCNDTLIDQELFICSNCLYHAPYVRSYFMEDIEAMFWGLIPTQYLSVLWYYNKGSNYAHLIHKIKYEGKKELAAFLGRVWANQRVNQTTLREIDYIIPIPMHPKKMKARGYNQAEWIAKGIKEISKTPILTNSVLKLQETASQTTKSGYERHLNPRNSFQYQNTVPLENKHLLFVDDVLTTGATMSACIEEFLHIKGIKISIMALCASK